MNIFYLEHLVPLLKSDINILSILHYLGSPLGFCTLIFDLMRNLNIYNACIYIHSIVVGYKSTYFVKDHSDAKNKYTEDDIVRMIEFLIDNIFVESGGVIFQQVIGIPMGTNSRNCAPLLADLFCIHMRLNLFRPS